MHAERAGTLTAREMVKGKDAAKCAYWPIYREYYVIHSPHGSVPLHLSFLIPLIKLVHIL
jgi:hypothetical protein